MRSGGVTEKNRSNSHPSLLTSVWWIIMNDMLASIAARTRFASTSPACPTKVLCESSSRTCVFTCASFWPLAGGGDGGAGTDSYSPSPLAGATSCTEAVSSSAAGGASATNGHSPSAAGAAADGVERTQRRHLPADKVVEDRLIVEPRLRPHRLHAAPPALDEPPCARGGAQVEDARVQVGPVAALAARVDEHELRMPRALQIIQTERVPLLVVERV